MTSVVRSSLQNIQKAIKVSHFSITIAMSEQKMLLDAQVISELKLSELISESLEALYPTMATDDDSTMATNND